MVTPLYIIAVALGIAFLLPLLEKAGRWVVQTVFFLTLTFFVGVSLQWSVGFLTHTVTTAQIFTAGFQPPISINLQMGPLEAVLTLAVNVLALLGGMYLVHHLQRIGLQGFVLFLLLTLGMNGLILTRDVFNLFVFIEITSIATYAVIGMDLNTDALLAGFKYMLAGSIASIFLLLGIIFLYSLTGTLNIDGMIAAISNSASASLPVITIALFSLLFSFMIEMKQYPANGWALDVYQSAHPGIAGMISAGTSGAMMYALYKLMPLFSPTWALVLAGLGLTTFVLSNLMAIPQKHTTRMLGYSSIGQMGLLLTVMGIGTALSVSEAVLLPILGALFFNHFFAKAGLYWLAGVVNRSTTDDWRVLRGHTGYQILLGIFLLALLGFPPFAGFFGKWNFIMLLAEQGQFIWIGFILLGSLLEAVYLLRWFGTAVRGEPATHHPLETPWLANVTLTLLATAVVAIGAIFIDRTFSNTGLLILPFAAAAVLILINRLPNVLRGSTAIAALILMAYWMLPSQQGLSLFFNIIFLGGGILILLASFGYPKVHSGFYALVVLMIGAMAWLTRATNVLQFFFAWEVMTASSYLLILQGKQARTAAYTYVLFSLGGAFVLLAGFATAHMLSPHSIGWDILANASTLPGVFLLVALGLLVKVAAIGVHLWAPGAYTEAPDNATPLLSAVLSKAGILGFVFALLKMGTVVTGAVSLNYLLGWVGVLTALLATLFAVFQEDAKKLLAYSSVGQVGYIVLGIALMSHLGWAAALWHSLNHMLFKGLLFLAIAGVIYRTGTRQMYQMGGLIKQMPVSFVSVLIGIIALSGIPPLTGFGGKWLLYEALMEKGWYFQTAVAFFASTIAFLYCFRLIHTIFLGQPKPALKHVKEAPVGFLIPQAVLIGIILFYSMRPDKLLQPISAILSPYFAPTLRWENLTVHSSLGYWNGTWFMIIVGIIFVLVTLWAFFITPRPQKVKPFNIVFAGERPERPESTHYAYQFFKPYERAFAPVLKPYAIRFWHAVSEWTTSTALALRTLYTGNAQTYLMHIFILGMMLFLILKGL